ncbi:MAG: hypothetical protein Q7V19_04885 [Bacteroidales bacterium]|nr:hypothetical protein [Bacteroidales bacterium]
MGFSTESCAETIAMLYPEEKAGNSANPTGKKTFAVVVVKI